MFSENREMTANGLTYIKSALATEQGRNFSYRFTKANLEHPHYKCGRVGVFQSFFGGSYNMWSVNVGYQFHF